MAFRRGGWHSDVPEWREPNHRPEGRLIGIEFEVEHEEGYVSILEALPEPRDPANRPVTETDGSLDDDNGVEIIFPPYKTSALKSKTSYFAKAMKALEDAGVYMHIDCGMHMNVNTTGWTSDQRTAYVYFFHHFNTCMLERIGGREQNGFWTQHMWMDWDDMSSMTDHEVVAGLRSNRIEVRFPQATTDMEKIKNLTVFLELAEDFIDEPGTIEFLRDEDDPEDSAVTERFMNWLKDDTIKGILNGYSPKAPRTRASKAA